MGVRIVIEAWLRGCSKKEGYVVFYARVQLNQIGPEAVSMGVRIVKRVAVSNPGKLLKDA